MDYASEIVEALECYYENKPFDLLPVFQDLFEATGEDCFAEVINNVCQENNLCPKCFTRLYIIKRQEDRGECRGETAYEDIFLKHCMNCGWSE